MSECRCRCHLGGAFPSCDQGPEIPGGRSCVTLHESSSLTDPAERPLATPRDLWNAADWLTKPTRTRLRRDDGNTEPITLPSLLDQLIDAMESGREGGTRGVPASKPPTDASALSLLIEIAQTVRDACRQRRIKRTFDNANDLRSLVSAINTEGNADRIDDCCKLIRSWCARIKATISNDPDRTWRMHGAACRVCASKTVPMIDPDGQEVRQPALIVHSDEGLIDKVECSFCGSVLTGPDLVAIVREARKLQDKPPTDEQEAQVV